MPLSISEDERRSLYGLIESYFLDQFGLEIGELQCDRLLTFMLGVVGARVYNLAIADAQAYLQIRLLDMEGDLHEHPPEDHDPVL